MNYYINWISWENGILGDEALAVSVVADVVYQRNQTVYCLSGSACSISARCQLQISPWHPFWVPLFDLYPTRRGTRWRILPVSQWPRQQQRFGRYHLIELKRHNKPHLRVFNHQSWKTRNQSLFYFWVCGLIMDINSISLIFSDLGEKNTPKWREAQALQTTLLECLDFFRRSPQKRQITVHGASNSLCFCLFSHEETKKTRVQKT